MGINSDKRSEFLKNIEEHNLKDAYNDLKFDVQAEVTFISTDEGGRKDPAFTGYRPAHKVREDYLTTGLHKYIEDEVAFPGETVLTNIKFITPEHYPSCLWVDKVINLQEGSRVVGFAKITKIFNEILKADKK